MVRQQTTSNSAGAGTGTFWGPVATALQKELSGDSNQTASEISEGTTQANPEILWRKDCLSQSHPEGYLPACTNAGSFWVDLSRCPVYVSATSDKKWVTLDAFLRSLHEGAGRNQEITNLTLAYTQLHTGVALRLDAPIQPGVQVFIPDVWNTTTCIKG